MYYIAGVTEEGFEVSCDFGFDMIERIVLDDIFMELQPTKTIENLVTEKRFSYFGDQLNVSMESMLGKQAMNLQAQYGLEVNRELSLATVMDRENLMTALRRAMIKVVNQSRWRCGRALEQPHLFGGVAIYSPQLLRSMLGREKYGVWDHGEDRTRALRVIYKFLNFLHERDDLRYIILYNELLCPHWEASGEISFNNKGELLYFKFFGRGNGQSYKYYPEMEVWQRT